MNVENQKILALVKEVRRQLDLSQENLASQAGIQRGIINWWELGLLPPQKSEKKQMKTFCENMIAQGQLTLPTDMLSFIGLAPDSN